MAQPPETHRVVEAGLPLKTLHLEVVDGPDKGQVFTGESERVTVGTADDNDLKLTDATVSRYHLELSRKADRVMVLDTGTTNGTEVGSVRVERATVAPGTVLKLGHTSLRVGDGRTVTLELFAGESLGGLYGRTPSMRRLMTKVARAGKSEVSVLLVGESGTGKELIAHALHASSARASRPFVTVDCGSLAPGLVASELFGHERGAFTGAERRHAGAFERAEGGTVFLDELGELPPPLQATLLGVLERRSFRRVGGTEELMTDVRIVSATHRDLRAEVNRGTFRLDLFYRLAVVRLDVPPLRERADDIPLLVAHFLKEAGFDGPLEELVSPKALAALAAHHWPGNVRELRNLVEATVAMGETPALEGQTQAAPSMPEGTEEPVTYREARARVLETFEAQYLRTLLEKSKGNVSAAARLARMDRSHLIELLQRHGLK